MTPLSGKVDEDHILRAFCFGADGLMVLACHYENCRSERGSHMAYGRVAHVMEALWENGLEEKRLFFGTLAP